MYLIFIPKSIFTRNYGGNVSELSSDSVDENSQEKLKNANFRHKSRLVVKRRQCFYEPVKRGHIEVEAGRTVVRTDLLKAAASQNRGLRFYSQTADSLRMATVGVD